MSLHAQQHVLGLALPPVTKSITFLLAYHHNPHTGRCYPSEDTLARESGYCERSIRDALRQAEKAGAIAIRRCGRGNRYSFPGLATAPVRAVGEPLPAPAPAGFYGAAAVELPLPIPAAHAGDEPAIPASAAAKLKGEESNPKEGGESAHARAPAQASPLDFDFAGQQIASPEQPDPMPAAQVADTRERHPEQPDPVPTPDPAPQHCEDPPPQAPRSPRRHAIPLPDDWGPTAADRAYAVALGLDPAEMTLAMARKYAGTGVVRDNWSLTYRSWCDIAAGATRSPARSGPADKPSKLDNELWAASMVLARLGAA